MRYRTKFACLALVVCALACQADLKSDLEQFVGYTILRVDTVEKVVTDNYGEKYVKLSRSGWMQIQGVSLILDPLPFSKVVILGKKIKKRRIEGIVYGLIIDDDIHEAIAEAP